MTRNELLRLLWRDKRLRCPQCGDRVFAAAAANVGIDKIEDVVMWCVDSGHWAGVITECRVNLDNEV
jgi:hypothetical protein